MRPFICWRSDGKNSNVSFINIYLKVNVLFLISVEHGVYLEKWDRIDYNRIKFLLTDPRFPDLPSYSTCVPSFEQPSNWGDFFGSRLRTYFVPIQTGNHYFFICKGYFLWTVQQEVYPD